MLNGTNLRLTNVKPVQTLDSIRYTNIGLVQYIIQRDKNYFNLDFI